ncbi:MAG: hypothetical protein ACOCUU_00180 [Nanoarchaeota archaeon]
MAKSNKTKKNILKEDKARQREIHNEVEAFVHPKYPGLDKVKFGLAGGILSGACVLITTLLALGGSFSGYTNLAIPWLEAMYGFAGYSVSWIGSLIGAVYGFVDVFAGLFIFAWIYNKFLGH